MLKEVECDKINAVTTVETGAKTEMELIQSFSVDHTLIVPGIFTSRVDSLGEYSVTTYDIRLKRPNREPVIDVAAMHSLEHIIATYLRNDPDWKNEVIYWGPMGCLTGFYLILKGNRTPQEIYSLPYLEANSGNSAIFEYPKTERLVTEDGQHFYDS